MNKLVFILFFLVYTCTCKAQSVGIGPQSPDNSALLDVNSTTKGFLPPKMTGMQRDKIQNPAEGLVIFNIDTNRLEIKTTDGWVLLATSSTVFMPTIPIGKQLWMAKNLDVAYYRNGDAIPQVTDQIEWAALTTGAWCYYNNNPEMGNTYGKLYNWYAVNDPRGLAPEGWHIPTDTEWAIMVNSLGGAAGSKMKEAGPAHWFDFSGTVNNGNNNSGWRGLPGGTWNYLYANFQSVNRYGGWWSASDSGIYGGANVRTLYLENGNSGFSEYSKTDGFSVRCIRN